MSDIYGAADIAGQVAEGFGEYDLVTLHPFRLPNI